MTDAAGLYKTASLLESQFPGITQRPKDYFRLVVPFVGANIVPATASVTVNVTVSQDADFVWVETVMTAFQNDHTTVIANPAVTVLVTDTSSGRSLMSAAEEVSNFAGTAQLPALHPWPQVVMRGATLSVTMTNLIATPAEIRLGLVGYKVYGTPLGQVARS